MFESTTNKTDEDEWRVTSATNSWQAISWIHHPPRSPRARCKAHCQPATDVSHLAEQGDGNSAASEVDLNAELVGVTAACNVLSAYEANSGFHYKLCLDLPENDSEMHPDISCQIDEKDVAVCKENWDEMVQSLTGDFVEDMDTNSSSGSDSGSLASSLMFDSSDWEYPNYASMPSTPKPSVPYGAYRTSPSISPPSKLNAFASSFTPSRSSVASLTFSDNTSPFTTRSTPSPTLHDFVFPSLNSSMQTMYPKLKIEKDDQGFYTNIDAGMEVVSPKSRVHSSTLLPAFLQDDHNRRKGLSSKTRALVDRLRSRQFTAHEGPGYNSKSSPADPKLHDSRMNRSDDNRANSSSSCSRPSSAPRVSLSARTHTADDNDGWIGLAEPHTSSPSKSRKSHGPNLCLDTVPMRRRTGSGPAALEEARSPTSPSSPEASLSSSSTSSSSSILSVPPTPPVIANNDGWIEVSELPHRYDLKKSSSVVPSETLPKAPSEKIVSEPLTFPTLNAPPPSRSRHSRSHARSTSTVSSSPKSSTKVKASKPTHAGIPLSTPANYYVSYPPAVPVAVSMPYAQYAVTPLMPYATMTPQYHPHQYAYQRQQTHPQQYTYHQRSHSAAVPSTLTMPADYVKPMYNALPMAIRPGMW
ncbi:hypothetical protein J3R30DRAFT_3450431 [Lentinula aciculospora]|uniref:Uncharacterized protein n=1 Tax=Lentinula aciculospora TaxID=153920 RepID=A0A9W9A1S4_9AGAR|nr:hypothetical protein J3R30DRAFT_3526792 [Lentinula aciculospora]KAJ4483653.1 hypothetical protein J3R30DRAFT_3450431 [Lentinula aciculospora]